MSESKRRIPNGLFEEVGGASGLTKAKFDRFSDKQKREEVKEALAQFCALDALGSCFGSMLLPERTKEVVMIILGKYMNGEIKEVRK